MHVKKLAFFLLVFFSFYTLFWLKVLNFSPFKSNSVKPVPSLPTVLGTKTEEAQQNLVEDRATSVTPTIVQLPENYKINVVPRRQMFNLSCEFAAASSIIYHFTGNADFISSNEKNAEEILVKRVGVSQNPNVGVRMGVNSSDNFSSLWENLNKLFGGTDYYGVHAPPFIDLFREYGVEVKILNKNQDLTAAIQKAISSGHLIMTWIRIGFGQPIDVELSYGSVPVVKGEHTVIITGYDQQGVFVLDPATGGERYIVYKNLFDSIQPFPVPFLETYPLASNSISVEESIILGAISGLDRSKLAFSILNGAGKIGAANEMIGILRDFGYHVTSTGNAENFDYEDVTIKIKNSKIDYLKLIKKDMELAYYAVASASAELPDDSISDAIIIVGTNTK